MTLIFHLRCARIKSDIHHDLPAIFLSVTIRWLYDVCYVWHIRGGNLALGINVQAQGTYCFLVLHILYFTVDLHQPYDGRLPLTATSGRGDEGGVERCRKHIQHMPYHLFPQIFLSYHDSFYLEILNPLIDVHRQAYSAEWDGVLGHHGLSRPLSLPDLYCHQDVGWLLSIFRLFLRNDSRHREGATSPISSRLQSFSSVTRTDSHVSLLTGHL